MPLKNPDPFSTQLLSDKIDPKVNPYITMLRESTKHGTLPLAFGPGLIGRAGQWRHQFESHDDLSRGATPQTPPFRDESRKLILEIGCHRGYTLSAMANAHPNYQFIGIDITFKRVVLTAQRLKKEQLNNGFCALANAQGLSKLFVPGELDGIIIFFPDPWVKKVRQAKNRLINESFAQMAFNVLGPAGFLWLKTDQALYHEEAQIALANAGLAHQGSRPSMLIEDFTSAFEMRFRDQGIPTYASNWLKLNDI